MAEDDSRDLWYTELRLVYNALRENGIESWLYLGTFLAAMREQRIFPWDHDIDLGCRWEDGALLPPVIQHLREQGWRVYPRDAAPNGWPFIVKIVREAPIDLIALPRIGQWRVMAKGTRLNPGAEYLTWWNEARYFQDLGKAICGPHIYPVPAPSEELLAYWYGPGWRFPAGDKSSHPARNPIRYVPQNEFLEMLEAGPAWKGSPPERIT